MWVDNSLNNCIDEKVYKVEEDIWLKCEILLFGILILDLSAIIYIRIL